MDTDVREILDRVRRLPDAQRAELFDELAREDEAQWAELLQEARQRARALGLDDDTISITIEAGRYSRKSP